MESYKDDYPDHAQGILQEAIQNSVDARLDDLDDVVVVIEYDPGNRTLRIRDYGTTGMSHCNQCDWGIRLDNGEDCHERDCKWGNFHYLGGLAKEVQQLGYRGQGKSLAVVAGDSLVVRTKVARPDGEHVSMASRWERDGDECYWEPVAERAMESTDKPGTELIITGVKKEVHESLLDYESLRADIQCIWFPAIQKGVRIRLGYAGKSLAKVGAPNFPKVATTESGKPIRRRRSRIPVRLYRELAGDLLDVELVLAEEPVPEDLRGIALIKNGTQVIERLTAWGRKVPTELQDRLYGWTTYHCTEDLPFLLVCEKPGHRGHRPHGYYRKTKELLLDQVEDFLLPYAKQQLKPKLTKKDRARARQNLQIIQEALENIPEFNPWSGEGMISKPPQPTTPPEHPYISAIMLDKEYYEYGQTAVARVVLLNPTPEYSPFIHLTLEALDEGLSRLQIWERDSPNMPLLKPAEGEGKGRVEVEFEVPISEDFGKGRNWLLCTLTNRQPPSPHESQTDGVSDELYDRKGQGLWVGVPPERRTRSQKGGGPSGDGQERGTLANLVPITAPLDPIEHEVIPRWSEAEIWFYTRGARMGGVYESDPRAADSVLYELISETIADRIMELRLEEDIRERLDKTQILDEFRQVDELRKSFLRACEALRTAAG